MATLCNDIFLSDQPYENEFQSNDYGD